MAGTFSHNEGLLLGQSQLNSCKRLKGSSSMSKHLVFIPYFLPVRYKYSRQHSALKHYQSVLLSFVRNTAIKIEKVYVQTESVSSSIRWSVYCAVKVA